MQTELQIPIADSERPRFTRNTRPLSLKRIASGVAGLAMLGLASLIPPTAQAQEVRPSNPNLSTPRAVDPVAKKFPLLNGAEVASRLFTTPTTSESALPAENEEAPPPKQITNASDIAAERSPTPQPTATLAPPTYRESLQAAVHIISFTHGINEGWITTLTDCEYHDYLIGARNIESEQGPFWGPFQFSPGTFKAYFKAEDLEPDQDFPIKDADYQKLMQNPIVSTRVAARIMRIGISLIKDSWPTCSIRATSALGGNWQGILF